MQLIQAGKYVMCQNYNLLSTIAIHRNRSIVSFVLTSQSLL